MPRETLITVREGTTAEWTAADAASGADPTRLLAAGEPGRDTTLNLLKFGDGVTTWADLPPAQSGTYVPTADLEAEEAARIAADALKANDNAVVKLVGDQTATGAKSVERVKTKLAPAVDVTHPDFGTADLTGVADSRAALMAATAAASPKVIPPGTYRIATSATLTGTWEFKEGAVLKPDSGATVTFTGAVVAGHQRIFDVSAGGKVVFGQYAKVDAVRARWWGAVGDGVTDDTAAIQAALDSASNGDPTLALLNGLTVELGPGIFAITDSLRLLRRSTRVKGAGVGTPPNWSGSRPGLGTTLKWAGAAGGTGMVNIVDSQWCEISDILFLGNDTTPPLAGIYFEAPDTGTTGGNQTNMVRRCRFGRWTYTAGALNDGLMDYGILIGGASNTNNDQFMFEDCEFVDHTSAGVGILSTQSIWGHLSNCLFASCAKGLMTSSAITGQNLTFNSCTDTDIEVNSTANVVVYGMWQEGSRSVVRCTASGGKFAVYGGLCRINPALMTNAFFAEHQSCGGAGQLLFDGWFLDTASGTKKLKAVGNTSATPGTVTVRGCPGLGSAALFDITAGTGTGGLEVDIRSGSLVVRRRLVASAALSTTESDWQLPSSRVGFYGVTPVVKPTGVAVDAASIHAALVSLGLISA
jgi:hypothetical protein